MTSSIHHRDAFSRIGGHPALDLVNTVEWRLSPSRSEDSLPDYADILRWTQQLELVNATDADALRALAKQLVSTAQDETSRIRRLREALYDALYLAGDALPVSEEYRDALAHARLTRVGQGWAWEFPVDLALPRRRIAMEAFDLLSRDDLLRLGQCQDAECGWVFLDTSPRHNRRWCVSEDCGNRNRVREFYERSRSTT